MAKRRRQAGTNSGPVVGSGRAIERAVVGFAEDLGRILGTTQKKAEDWLNQRQAIAEQLTQIRDTATKYLQQIAGGGADMAVAVRRGRRGRPRTSMNQATAPDDSLVSSGQERKRREMTAAQRKAVGDRMKKYWAARRAAQGAKKR